MKVALVCPYAPSVPGGVQAQVLALAAVLHKRGLDVTVVAPGAYKGAAPLGSLAPAPGDDGGYSFAGIGRSVSIATNGSRAPVAPGPLAMSRTVRVLRAEHRDVVHIHEPLAPGASLGALIGGPKPIVATFHRSDSDLIYRCAGRILRPLVGRIDSAVAVSEAARDTAAAVLGCRVADIGLVPNGIDLEPYLRHSRDAGAPGTTMETGRRLQVLFIGRHEERKGLRILLEAFDHLGRTDPSLASSCRLVVVGQGPQTETLRARAGNSGGIEWPGAVDQAEKSRLLASSDVFVAPSLRGESFGVVLLEAMAAGVAVIASDIPGYRLVAADAAQLVPPGDVPALAGALSSLLRDPATRSRLAAAGASRALAYSIDATAESYISLYASAVARRP